MKYVNSLLPPDTKVRLKEFRVPPPPPPSFLTLPDALWRSHAAEAWKAASHVCTLIDARERFITCLDCKLVPDDTTQGEAKRLAPFFDRLQSVLMAWACLHGPGGQANNTLFSIQEFMDIWMPLHQAIHGQADILIAAGRLPPNCLPSDQPPKRLPKGHRPQKSPSFDFNASPPVIRIPAAALLAYRELRNETGRLLQGLRRAPLLTLKVLGPPPAPDMGISAPARPVVTVALGVETFTVSVNGGSVRALDVEFNHLLTQFVCRILADTPNEPVPWKSVNRVVDMVNGNPHTSSDDSDAHSATMSGSEKASAGARDLLYRLRTTLVLALGKCPGGGKWVRSRKGRGIWLTDAADWILSQNLRASVKGQSVYSHAIDPFDLAELAPNRDEKLPARPRSNRSSLKEDDDWS